MLRHVVVIRQCDISSSVLKYDVVFLWAGEKCDLLSCGLAKGIVSFFGVIIFLFTLVIQNRDILSSPWRPCTNWCQLLNDSVPTVKKTRDINLTYFMMVITTIILHSRKKMKVINTFCGQNNVLLQSFESLKSVTCCLLYGNMKLCCCGYKHFSSILFLLSNHLNTIFFQLLEHFIPFSFTIHQCLCHFYYSSLVHY